jgi:hypothetical protein
MDCVTGRSIAYVVTLVCALLFHASRALTHCLPTQVYFSLSSSESNQKAGGAFELSAMYWQVVRLLENEPGLKEEAGEILLWWNQYVFFHIRVYQLSLQANLPLQIRWQKRHQKVG